MERAGLIFVGCRRILLGICEEGGSMAVIWVGWIAVMTKLNGLVDWVYGCEEGWLEC